MATLKCEYFYDTPGESGSWKFKTEKEAIAFAKKEFFSPKSEWYKQTVEEWYLEDELEARDLPADGSIEDLVEHDFEEFKSEKKFTWNDGLHDMFEITLT